METVKETADLKCVHQKKNIDEARFKHIMTYGQIKILPRRTTAHKVLHKRNI